MRMLCIAARHDPTGYVAVNHIGLDSDAIARMTGGDPNEVRTLIGELDRNGVFTRDRYGTIFNRRMVQDEKRHKTAVRCGKKGGNPKLCKDKGISGQVKQAVNGQHKARDKPLILSPFPLERVPPSAGADAPFSGNGLSENPIEKDPDAELFDRGREVLGKSAGGLIVRLRSHCRGDIKRAMEIVDSASRKNDPREFVGRILAGPGPPAGRQDILAAADEGYRMAIDRQKAKAEQA